MNHEVSKYYMVSGVQFNHDYILDKLAKDHRISVLLVMEIINTPATKFNIISERYDIPISDIVNIINCFIGFRNDEN